jgi:hypothetical protein
MIGAAAGDRDVETVSGAEDGARAARVLVALEQRFERTPDGAVWGPGVCGTAFWARYLEVFDAVTVIARLRSVLVASDGFERCNGADVTFAPVPHYLGPWGFL